MELSGKKTEMGKKDYETRRKARSLGKKGRREGRREGRKEGEDKSLYGEFICEASSFPSHE